MENFARLMLMFVCLCGLAAPAAQAQGTSPDFPQWLEQLRADARAAGISQATVDTALTGIEEPQKRVLDSDRAQPETIQPLADYVAARVSPERIAEGRQMLRRYPTWLGRVERKYGVQRRFIVALWGIESGYGRHTGKNPVIPALVTLAFDTRRGDYFRKELFDALRILDAGQITLPQMQGSWAGAMGQFQFMPSSYRQFAVDGDGDGRIDLWNSIPDALASAANYLAQAGWQDDQTWGRPVRLPKQFDRSLAGLKTRLTLARWQSLGVRTSSGHALPRRNLQASLIIPEGDGEPAYLVYDNFRVLLRWNRANTFAVAVGTLADSYAEGE
jgi:membrane-bound lytic murein transglycosylase B